MNTKIFPELKSVTCTGGSVRYGDFALSESYVSQVPAAAGLVTADGRFPINLALTDGLGRDEYDIAVAPESIEVRASSAAGGYYALCTLDQLSCLNGGVIDCCRIHDAPDMAERAFSDDISRGQISTLDDFKRIVRRIAYLKGNVYMPYIEDSMEFQSCPESGKYTDPVRKEEFRELVAYAARYYVKVIPIINVLGHWDRNGKLSYFSKMMLHRDDDPQQETTSALDTRVPETREMIRGILDEVIDTFAPVDTIHVGGDEVVDYFRNLGREQAAELYCSHYRFVCDYLASRGIKPMMYSDMFTPVWGDHELPFEAINDISPNVDFVYWDYSARGWYKGIEQLQSKGRSFYISPATMTYGRALPDYRMTWLNAKEMAFQAGSSAKGMIMSTWGDGGMCFREESWFGNFAGANFAWNSGSSYTFDEAVGSFFAIMYGIDVDVPRFKRMMDYDITMYLRLNPGKEPQSYESYNGCTHLGELVLNTLYAPCFRNIDLPLQNAAADMTDMFEESYRYFSQLVPAKNKDTYAVFVFDIRRTVTALLKIALLKSAQYSFRDEAKKDVEPLLALSARAREDLEEAERLWFSSNRLSGWKYYEARALDLAEGLNALARYCDNVRKFGEYKILGRVY